MTARTRVTFSSKATVTAESTAIEKQTLNVPPVVDARAVRRLGSIDVVTVRPLVVIGVGLGATGTAKLAGAKVIKARFDRWGYPAWSRIVTGAIEIGVAATAVSALRDPQARPVAAVGTLCAMAGAITTHARAGDSAMNYVPPIGLAAAAVATLAGR
jgi:hypothetical protein